MNQVHHFNLIVSIFLSVNSIACRNVELIEPQQTALAKLCSYSIYASVELQQNSLVKNEVLKTTNSMDIVRPSTLLVFIELLLLFNFRTLIIRGHLTK